MNIAVVNGSLSESSSGAALAGRLLAQIEAKRPAGESPIQVTWINLRSLGHDLLDNLYTGVPSPSVRAAYSDLAAADLILALTPTYQASYSGLFKLFWDTLPEDAIRGKYILLAATGGTGRHGLMIDHTLRPLFAYLGAMPLPTALFAATQDWGDPGLEANIGVDEPLEHRIDRAANDVWSAVSGRAAAPASSPEIPDRKPSAADAFPGFKDFESLLGRRREDS